jgi:hypothetical protein
MLARHRARLSQRRSRVERGVGTAEAIPLQLNHTRWVSTGAPNGDPDLKPTAV